MWKQWHFDMFSFCFEWLCSASVTEASGLCTYSVFFFSPASHLHACTTACLLLLPFCLTKNDNPQQVSRASSWRPQTSYQVIVDGEVNKGRLASFREGRKSLGLLNRGSQIDSPPKKTSSPLSCSHHGTRVSTHFRPSDDKCPRRSTFARRNTSAGS